MRLYRKSVGGLHAVCNFPHTAGYNVELCTNVAKQFEIYFMQVLNIKVPSNLSF